MKGRRAYDREGGDMMRAQQKVLVIAAACWTLVAPTREAWAGPWTRSIGSHYAKVSELYFASDTFVASSGERVEGSDYAALTTALYAEVGVAERAHLTAVPAVGRHAQSLR